MNDANDNDKVNRWFNAEVRKGMHDGMFKGILYLYVRKHHVEGKVTVFNGRHFIQQLTTEECRKYLILGSVCKDQQQVEKDYDWYLNA